MRGLLAAERWLLEAEAPETARVFEKNCCVCEIDGDWAALLEADLLELAAALEEAGGWLIV